MLQGKSVNETISETELPLIPLDITVNTNERTRLTLSLEITTNIGCPVGCLKYCPQESLLRRYGSDNRMMSIEVFKKILEHTPRNVNIIFSGFSEPFANPNCIEFIKLASAAGHKIDIFSTLWGVTRENVEELKQLHFRAFCVHLPDGHIMHEPQTKDYRNVFFELQSKLPNIVTMSMNENFVSNNRENVVRCIQKKAKPYGWCSKFHVELAPVVLPDGSVYLCCFDFGLRNPVGNLIKSNYSSIKKSILKKEGKFSECQYCSWNKNKIKHNLAAFGKRLFYSL